MTPGQFRNLRLDAAYLIGAPDPQGFAESGELQLGEFHLGLFADERDGRIIHCYADLGAVHEDTRACLFEEMLALNLTAAGRGPVVFGFDRESGHAILKSRIAAASVESGAALAAQIGRVQSAALELRRRLPGQPSAHSAASPFQLA